MKNTRRTPGCELVAKIIPKTIKAMGGSFEQEYLFHYMCYHWSEIVGVRIADKVRPVSLKYGRLCLNSVSAPWQNELKMLQQSIVDKINNKLGRQMVKEIYFGHDLSEAKPLPPEEKPPEPKPKVRCAMCGRLTDSGYRLCPGCERREREKKRSAIRKFLLDMPWATLADVRKQMECTAWMVNKERALLVQYYSSKIKYGEWDSFNIKMLVMLHKSVPPQRITTDMIKKTIYKLRFDLRLDKSQRKKLADELFHKGYDKGDKHGR